MRIKTIILLKKKFLKFEIVCAGLGKNYQKRHSDVRERYSDVRKRHPDVRKRHSDRLGLIINPNKRALGR